jgi:Flp pilus assembly protein, protease CpaA
VLFLGEAVLGGLLLAAAACDWKKGKIPNALILFGWCASLVFAFWQNGGKGLLERAATILLVLSTGFFIFSVHMAGAGDIKLCSVIGGMQGLLSCMDILVVSAILAGGFSLFKLIRKRMLTERFLYAWLYFTAGRAGRKPYYEKSRDGTDCTILLAPFLAAGYLLIVLRRWGGM